MMNKRKPSTRNGHSPSTVIQNAQEFRAWSYKHQAIKTCKGLLNKCKTQEARQQMEFVLKVLSESHYQGLGQERENSLTNELKNRGTTEDVQDYILKNMMGAVPAAISEEPETMRGERRASESRRSTTRHYRKALDEIKENISPEQTKDLRTQIYKLVLSKSVNPEDILEPYTAPIVEVVEEPRIITPAWPTIEDQQKLDSILQNSTSWLDFDAFEISRLTGGRPLVVIGTHLLKQHKLLELCNIEENILINFLNVIEEAYPSSNNFHCSLHGADVMQTLNALFHQSGFISQFQPYQLLACLIAAAVHDVDHPGLSNNFLIQIGAPIAITYNDTSVLENHHLATFFRIVRRPECNIFKNFTFQQKREVRKIIIDLVLATDMTMHVQLVDDFNSLTETATSTTLFSSAESTKLLLKLSIHLADISNPSKKFIYCEKWASLVMEEFYFQGDLEDSLGLPISRECDRLRSSKENVQMGFMDFVLRPLLEVWVKLFPQMDIALKQMQENFESWKKLADERL
eukprot:c8023_g1_i1.p1 GENE.c8023_g1_i1~~c8023_g1_i1.p1  ORF type:complete len:517 (-),score=177.19 c8023_g1_i1:167-1717(-)